MKSVDLAIIGTLLGFLVVMECLQIVKNKELQTQIDELRIVVNQKSLPALILDPLDIR